MAKKKITKKQEREMQKVAKKHPVLVAIIVILVLIIGGCCFLHWQRIIHVPFLDSIIPQKELDDDNKPSGTVGSQAGEFTDSVVTEISGGNVSIHFLELGNKYTGDCTLIKVGDTEVLIDAGSRKGSAEAIVSYVNQFCTDGVLEYVIATHAHQDHIAGFVGTTKIDGVFESFVCETIIDYSLSNSDAQIRYDYEELRDLEVSQGAKHYTAYDCVKGLNGAQSTYTLGEGVTMRILEHDFYSVESSDENDYSVCMLLTETYEGGENNYLFTGDLEKDGEESLLAKNADLPKCKLFKAGHHGSPTSSTSELLAKIQPEIVTVCCCCGSDEYTENVANQFPSQAFVDRVAPYTIQVYVTTMVADNADGYQSMNGNIVIVSKNGVLSVLCSNNDTVFKDTEWFKKNRTMPDAWVE